MRPCEGETRVVYVGETFAVKLPIFRRIKKMVNWVRYVVGTDMKRGNNPLEFLKRWKEGNSNTTLSFPWAISGLLANLRESNIPPELEDIIVPTKLSLFGILNLQDVAADLPAHITDDELVELMLKAIGDDFKKDRHGFSHTDNFGIHEGKVKMRDCGGEKTLHILEKHQATVRRAFAELAKQCGLPHSATPPVATART